MLHYSFGEASVTVLWHRLFGISGATLLLLVQLFIVLYLS